MKINFVFNEKTSTLIFNFELDFLNGDRDNYINHKNKTIKLVKNTCKFILPSRFKKTDLHNDLVALSALLIIYPFIGSTIEFKFSISHYFYSYCVISGKTIIKPNTFIGQINERDINNHSLAYSGGIDSTAASFLLSNTTQHIFLDRINPIVKTDFIYRKDQIYYSIDCLQKLKKKVVAVKTDLEWMREPVGFIFDLA